jgi:hypothetical protein
VGPRFVDLRFAAGSAACRSLTGNAGTPDADPNDDAFWILVLNGVGLTIR